MDPSKQRNAIAGSIQFYDGYLYYLENNNVQRYDPKTAVVETIAVDPTARETVHAVGLHVSSKGIYIYNWAYNAGMNALISNLYKLDGNSVIKLYELNNAHFMSVYLTMNYIIVDMMDLTLKAAVKKVLNYRGQEVPLDW
jgi:hypothetical protein